MATLTDNAARALEIAARSVSHANPQFTDFLRANVQLATALASELARLQSTWATGFGDPPGGVASPQSEGEVDQVIAAIQPDDLVTWIRVNHAAVERLCVELAEIEEQWASGIRADAILPMSDSTSVVHDPFDDTRQMRIDVGAVAASTVRVLTMPDQDVDLTPGVTFSPAGEKHYTLYAGPGLVV